MTNAEKVCVAGRQMMLTGVVSDPRHKQHPCFVQVENTFSCEEAETTGGLAQLGERLHGMQEVSGSSPLSSTQKS